MTMISTPDVVNASFEALAAVVSALNIRQIVKDKKVRGISVWPTCFFTLWGLWNLYYYPSLSQPLSAAAALLMVGVNLTWLYLYRKYNHARTNKDFHLNSKPVLRLRKT